MIKIKSTIQKMISRVLLFTAFAMLVNISATVAQEEQEVQPEVKKKKN